jgi:Icc-related predicted phosphoesterase
MEQPSKPLTIILSTFTLISLTFIITVNIIYSPYDKIKSYTIGDGKTLKIGILSDSHINLSKKKEKNYSNNLLKAFKTLKENNINVIIFAGDITENGKKEEYKEFKKIYNSIYSSEENKKEKPILNLIMGNHEYYSFPYIPSLLQKRFTDILKEKPFSHKIINGYHFINWSSMDGTRVTCNINIKWLKNQIEIALKDDSSKPIFITTHLNPKGTIYGSEKYGNSIIYQLLKSYPNIISISGNSHYSIIDERNIWQGDFTAIATQSISYIRINDHLKNNNYNELKYFFGNYMGYICDVNNNIVKFKRINLEKNLFYGENWFIEVPIKKEFFKYKIYERILSSIAPVFRENSKIEIFKNNSNDFYYIKFNQALHKNFVHSYRIVLKKGNIKKYEFIFFSDFYLMPDERKSEIIFKLPKIRKGNYNIFIFARESFGKESFPLKDSVNFE